MSAWKRWRVAGALGAAVVCGVVVMSSSGTSGASSDDEERAVEKTEKAPDTGARPRRIAKREKSAAAPARSEAVVEATWGSGPDQLGRRGGDESSPEGPMSFFVGEDGRVSILDQVNGRIQIYEDGRVVASAALPTTTFQDIAQFDDGLVALDRFKGKNVVFVDREGNITHEAPVEGPGVENAGDVTALSAERDGAWVEVDHQKWVRVADASGAPDPDRPTALGRRAPDGVSTLRLARAGGARASLVQIAPDGGSAVTWIEFDGPIWALNALEIDAGRGLVFVGAELAWEDEDDFSVDERMEQVVVIDQTGSERARVSLPPSTGAEEAFRTLRVGPDGALYQLVISDGGVTVRRVEL